MYPISGTFANTKNTNGSFEQKMQSQIKENSLWLMLQNQMDAYSKTTRRLVWFCDGAVKMPTSKCSSSGLKPQADSQQWQDLLCHPTTPFYFSTIWQGATGGFCWGVVIGKSWPVITARRVFSSEAIEPLRSITLQLVFCCHQSFSRLELWSECKASSAPLEKRLAFFRTRWTPRLVSRWHQHQHLCQNH